MTTVEANKKTGVKSLWQAMSVAWLVYAVFGLVFPIQGYSAGQSVEQCITTKNGSIVITAENEGSVILKDGRITASEGESIRLLPGTHIRGEEPLTVSIVSQEYQDALAEEAASEERKQAVESILKRRESTSPLVESLFMIRAYGGSGSRSYLNKEELYCAVLPVRTQTSVSAPVTANHQRHSYTENNQVNTLCNTSDLYQLVMRWGARAETIAVMRT